MPACLELNRGSYDVPTCHLSGLLALATDGLWAMLWAGAWADDVALASALLVPECQGASAEGAARRRQMSDGMQRTAPPAGRATNTRTV